MSGFEARPQAGLLSRWQHFQVCAVYLNDRYQYATVIGTDMDATLFLHRQPPEQKYFKTLGDAQACADQLDDRYMNVTDRTPPLPELPPLSAPDAWL